MAGNTLDWATPEQVQQQLLDVLQQAGVSLHSDDAARLQRNVAQGMAVASDDIVGYLCAGRGISLATLAGWANKEGVFIDQSVYRTFERASGLSMPTQDRKPSQFDHREKFKDPKWSPTDAAGNVLEGDIVEAEDTDSVEGSNGRGNNKVFIGQLNQTHWDPKKDTRY